MNGIFAAISADHVYLLRLLVALVLGGIVGMERQAHGRAAGLRTNILVCLGSALVIVSFQKFMDHSLPDATSALRMDPARAAAGVITGIGFLGAGTIVKSKEFVRGLTTAASVWVVAAIGVAVGLGEVVLAVFVTLMVLIALVILHQIPINQDIYGEVTISGHGPLECMKSGRDILEQDGFVVKHTTMKRGENNDFSTTFIVRHRHRDAAELISDKMLAVEGIESVRIA